LQVIPISKQKEQTRGLVCSKIFSKKTRHAVCRIVLNLLSQVGNLSTISVLTSAGLSRPQPTPVARF